MCVSFGLSDRAGGKKALRCGNVALEESGDERVLSGIKQESLLLNALWDQGYRGTHGCVDYIIRHDICLQRTTVWGRDEEIAGATWFVVLGECDAALVSRGSTTDMNILLCLWQ